MIEHEGDQDTAQDFRVRNAARKRQRMRSRLLQATMQVCGAATAADPAVIDDVIRTAGVSRGTFYKYFASLDEARRALGQHLTNELVEGLVGMFEGVDDPLQRTAAGWIVIMARAASDPSWAGFVTGSERFTDDSVLLAAVRRNTRAGMNRGVFQVDDPAVAVDFQMGVAMEAMRRLMHEPKDAAGYIVAMTSMGLRGLGVGAEQADAAAHSVFADVAARAAQFLPWWRPLDQVALTGSP